MKSAIASAILLCASGLACHAASDRNRRARLSLLFTAVGVLCLALSPSSRAALITYDLDNAQATFGYDQVTYPLGGSFTYDPSNSSNWSSGIEFAQNVNLYFMVSSNSSYGGGLYRSPMFPSSSEIKAYNTDLSGAPGDNELDLFFAAPLDGGKDQLASLILTTAFVPPAGAPLPGCTQDINVNGYASYTCYGAVTGEAVPVGATPVPEPATWAMLLAGLGMLGFAMRDMRRRQIGARI
jgi:hypothetical protein